MRRTWGGKVGSLVPSASLGPRGHGELAAWHLFRIAGDGKAPRITLDQRGCDLAGLVVRRQEIALMGEAVGNRQ